MDNNMNIMNIPVLIGMGIAALALTLDLALPLGVAGGVPYVALVLVGWWIPHRRAIFILAGIAAVFTLLGYMLSPAGGIHWVVLTNRAYALFAIAITAIILNHARRTQDQLEAHHALLEDKVAARTQALSASEARLESAQRIAHLGHWYWDADRDDTFCSTEALRICGLDSSTESKGFAGLCERVHPDDREAFKRRLTRSVSADEPFSFEHRIVRPDGEERMVLQQGELAASGRVEGTVLDITERLRAEYKRNHTRKLEALGGLAGGIAHSLNNLLHPMLTLTRMTLDEAPKGSDAHENLSRVIQAGERAKNLAGRILEFSHRDEPQLSCVELHQVVTRALALLYPTVPSTVSLVERIDRQSGSVLADPTQIESAFMNLISNAVDAFDGHTGKIEVSLGRITHTNGDDSYLRLAVKDDGAGMDEALCEQIFDPFFTTKKVGAGTGLGLSTAYGIITRHKGHMNVDSAPGKGTTVEMLLPLVTTPQTQKRASK